jgi:penicillin-binding protein 1C
VSRLLRRRVGLLLAALVAVAAFLAVPVTTPEAPVGTLLLDGRGRMLDARIAADEQWRFPPASDAPPERFAVALVTAEDARFRWHPGVDPVAVVRAIGSNLTAGEVVSGASPLTMQVVRISRGNPPRTFGEKAREAVLALRLEAAHDKDAILSMYAHHAPFGGNTVGVEAAAWRYFGRPAGELSWAEAATLAVLPNSPGLIHPGRNRGALRAKRDRLLETLSADGHLDAASLALAKLEPLPGRPRPLPGLASHLLQRAGRAGQHVTTLDVGLQARVRDVATRHQHRLAANHVHGLAVLVADVPTGEVRAYVGNAPVPGAAEHGHYVDVVRAPRSTGSTLKPFLYASMLEAGELLPDELVPDIPVRFGSFAPKNFDLGYQGALPASQALARSRNVPTVWMLRDHGVPRFYGSLQRWGMTTLHRPADDYGLSLVLGGAEGTLWDFVVMYRHLGLSAQGEVGDVLHWRPSDRAPSGATPIEAGAAWSTLEALLEVTRPGLQGSWRDLAGGRKIAWKTGTSVGFRDGWAIGVTPQTVVGVWVGNADGEGRPELTGFQAASPLLFDLF